MDKFIRIVKGYGMSMVLFGMLTLVMGAILKFTPLQESGSKIYLLLAFCFTCFFVGLYMSSFFQRAGLLVGLIFSAGFIILALIIVASCFQTTIGLSSFSFTYFIPVAAGGIGGIIGANLKKQGS
ncbi:MAG: TIGR04086 family membrane protein [Anaerovoracaceae bacterium]